MALKKRTKIILGTLAVILIVAALGFFFVLPGYVEGSMNVVLKAPPYTASERASELHRRLFVADLHADSLLWDRDLLERGTRGHVDIPRLIEGNVALQAFTIVTKTPRGQNIENNDDSSDNITLLAIAQRWPIPAWSSLTERALYQSRKLHEVAERSDNRFVIIKTAADLIDYAERRASDPQITAGFLGIEGAQALDGKLENLDELFAAGFRMMAPTHFSDNDIGGSAHGVVKGGLTEKGREMIQRMEEKRMIVDLAHASPQTIDDVLAMASRPVIVSHTGVKATCDNTRNLSDEQIKAIARGGGLIGIGFWDTAVCGKDGQAIARAIKHVANLVGAGHVALGSDFDGAIPAPFDTTGVAQITDALLAEGFSEGDIEMIMGGNVLRFLKENLP
ncbi:MAG TPA: dipeptidase [Blastocatellia bacterium]|jgi:microsomal dipeptidase-like Zn-dependent dipeptidase